jgi:hypothetical protein
MDEGISSLCHNSHLHLFSLPCNKHKMADNKKKRYGHQKVVTKSERRQTYLHTKIQVNRIYSFPTTCCSWLTTRSI